jgi:8-oxo-dGTP diphosphatase
MAQRGREPFLGTWMFPAGFVEFGENPSEALAREFMEESGLIVLKTSLVDILQSHDDPRSPNHFVIFYLAEAAGEIRNVDVDENKGLRWFSITDPPEIGFPTHQQIMKRLQTGELRWTT